MSEQPEYVRDVLQRQDQAEALEKVLERLSSTAHLFEDSTVCVLSSLWEELNVVYRASGRLYLSKPTWIDGRMFSRVASQ